MKVCTLCGETKPLEAFGIDNNLVRADKRKASCKACNNARVKMFVADNPELAKRQWRDSELRKKYGITLLEYESMVAAQNGLCAICHRPSDGGRTLDVDHNHGSKRVRKLLCRRHNMGIGYFAEDPALLRQAALYLEEFLEL